MENDYSHKKCALVTGVAGFIGRHIAEALTNLGIKVFGIDNLSGGELTNIPNEVEFYQRDCKLLDTYQDLIPNGVVIYHCAAIAGEGYSVVSPYKVTENNVFSNFIRAYHTVALIKLLKTMF